MPSVTKADQENQVWFSDVYNDGLAAGQATLETASTDLMYDMNALRTQVHRLWDATMGSNWYDDAPTVNAKKRSTLQLNTDLDTVEIKPFLFPDIIVTDVTVPAAQAYVVLSVAGAEAPTQTAAVGAVTTEGAVVAFEAAFPSATTTEVAGPNALSPLNLCAIRDAATGEPIISSNGKEIFGLFQSESNVDGHTFNDIANRVQISFVEENAAGNDLVQTAAADIATKVINYQYVRRLEYLNLPEWAFLFRVFEDQVGGTDVTRQRAYTNQGATPVDIVTNAILDLEGAGLIWSIRDDAEQRLFAVIEGSAGGTSTVQVAGDTDLFDVNAVVNDFLAGMTVRSGGARPITVGVTDGEITTTAGDLMVRANQELLFDDVNQTGSTWAQDGIKLSETTAEWDAFEAAFGEVSLLNAIVQAQTSVSRCKVYAAVLANIAANTLLEGPGGPGVQNISADLCDYQGLDFVADVDIYINGSFQWNGANAAANKDVYPSAVGAEQAVGCFYCEYALKFRGGGGNEDVIAMITWG